MLNVYLSIVYYWKICNISRFRALLQIKFCWLIWLKTYRSSCPEAFCKKGVLRNFAKFTGKHLCQSLFLNKVAGLWDATSFKKEALAQVFSCEFCKISKSTFSYRPPPGAASEHINLTDLPLQCKYMKFTKETKQKKSIKS